ncbi:hypothetical protein CANARDRAFT_27317 [[Candida] arabinofermentans NRRL YB-2248]|uniref:t-SNARE coiled-coil homology domain-containing protein n=1 Tax=[Candida] arabinofermentans NRRL YB-2248 TaxID=983967 RepID=A0A1E4T5E2_9ASCO|nr:hypothetical protein CANARDRAFT_27317 [[Candida] arabinofermentans NRRL YB-2248]
MSDLFDTYESDFKLAYSEAQQKIQQIYGLSDQNKRIALMQQTERLLDDDYDLLDSMTLEIQQIATHQRSSYNAKVRTYKQDMERLKSDLKSLMDDNDRVNLFGGSAANQQDDYNQRQTLLTSNSSLDRSTQRLHDATRTALETEDVGSSILDNLRSQREQILNARDTLNEADTYVDRSLKTLKSMTRRMATNKMITYGIIAVLIMLIFLVLISKFR